MFFTTASFADVRIDAKRVEQVVGQDGNTYIINESSNTISDGQNEYKFSVSGNRESIEITYPDGATYWESGDA